VGGTPFMEDADGLFNIGIHKHSMEEEKHNKFDKKAVLGLILLLGSFVLGAVLRNSAQISDIEHPRGFTGDCDTYLKWLCIPTYFFSINLSGGLWLVLNLTSLISSGVLFIAGVILVRQ
jgi:hypothetical protein